MSRAKKKPAKAKSRVRDTNAPQRSHPTTIDQPAIIQPKSIQFGWIVCVIPLISVTFMTLEAGLLSGLLGPLSLDIRASMWQIAYIFAGIILLALVSVMSYPSPQWRRDIKLLTFATLLWSLTNYIASLSLTLTDLAIAFFVFGGISAAMMAGSASQLINRLVEKRLLRWSLAAVPLVGLLLGLAISQFWQTNLDWRWVCRVNVVISAVLAAAWWWECRLMTHPFELVKK